MSFFFCGCIWFFCFWLFSSFFPTGLTLKIAFLRFELCVLAKLRLTGQLNLKLCLDFVYISISPHPISVNIISQQSTALKAMPKSLAQSKMWFFVAGLNLDESRHEMRTPWKLARQQLVELCWVMALWVNGFSEKSVNASMTHLLQWSDKSLE